MADEQHIGDQYFTGEDKSLRFTISTNGVADNISGWAISWMVKANKLDADAAAIIVKTTAGGIALTTPASGILTVTVDDDNLAAIHGGTLYYHELKRTDAGFETVLSYGQFTLRQAVHQ